MIFTLERVTQPAVEPLTLAQMKTHLRAYDDVTTDDEQITALITASREWVEDYTGRALIDQTWRLTLGDDFSTFGHTDANTVTPIYTGTVFPSADGGILLRKSPAIAITSFASVDSAGAETVIDAAAYEVREPDSKWPRLFGLSGGSWSGPLRVTFRAGFADRLGSPVQGAEMVPVRFTQAMKLWAEAMYDRDEKMMPLLLDTAERLIKPERVELQIA